MSGAQQDIENQLSDGGELERANTAAVKTKSTGQRVMKSVFGAVKSVAKVDTRPRIFFKDVPDEMKVWNGTKFAYFRKHLFVLALPLFFHFIWVLLKTIPYTGDGCFYTGPQVRESIRDYEYPVDATACGGLSTGAAACATNDKCYWNAAPGVVPSTGNPEPSCDLAIFEDSKMNFYFLGPRMSSYGITDVIAYTYMSWWLIQFISMTVMFNIWGLPSQGAYAAFCVLHALALWNTHTTEGKTGLLTLLKGPAPFVALLVCNMLMKPWRVPLALQLGVTMCAVVSYAMWAVIGAIYLRAALPAVQEATADSGFLFKTIMELLFATIFFSVWVPVGSKKVGPLFLFCICRCTAFNQGCPLTPEDKWELENYVRILVNGVLDLYRYAYGRGALLKLSPSSFAIIVIKDLFYDILHFGVNFSAEWHCFNMKLDASKGKIHKDFILPFKFKVFRTIANINRKFNRIDVATAITWMYNFDAQTEEARLEHERTVNEDEQAAEEFAKKLSDIGRKSAVQRINSHKSELQRRSEFVTGLAVDGEQDGAQVIAASAEVAQGGSTLLEVEGAEGDQMMMKKQSTNVVKKNSSIVKKVSSQNSFGKTATMVSVPRQSYAQYETTSYWQALKSLKTDPFMTSNDQNAKAKATSVVGTKKNAKSKTGPGSAGELPSADAGEPTPSADEESKPSSSGKGKGKGKGKGAKGAAPKAAKKAKPSKDAEDDVMNIDNFELDDEQEQETTTLNEDGTVQRYNRNFQFANHRIIATNVPRLEPFMVIPGRKTPYPVSVADLTRARAMLEFVQQENFQRFQLRMMIRLFTASVVLFSPILGLVGDASFYPGFPRHDVESREVGLRADYLVYTLIFLLTDLASYLSITCSIHFNEDSALKNWRDLVGQFMWQIERGGRQKMRGMYGGFGIYYAFLACVMTWDPYRNRNVMENTGIKDKDLDFAPHIYRACGSPDWMPLSFNP